MNKWKIAFWITLALLVFVTLFGFYSIIDQGVTITHMRDGYTAAESDLETLSLIINETNLSKSQIQEILKQHDHFEYVDFSSDTVPLQRIGLVFEKEKLISVEKEW